jgi:putative phosphoesterase
MKRILVFGDTHIPSRRDSIPSAFYSHIESTNYDFALVTGDLVREVDMREAMPPLPHCYIVQGNMDYGSFNHHERISIEEFEILLLHGTQFRPRGNIEDFYKIIQQVDVDIGIHGHTHQHDISLHKNKLMLNPGTISGATGGWRGVTDASFMELEISEAMLSVILYHTDWKVVKESRLVFRKTDGRIVAER